MYKKSCNAPCTAMAPTRTTRSPTGWSTKTAAASAVVNMTLPLNEPAMTAPLTHAAAVRHLHVIAATRGRATKIAITSTTSSVYGLTRPE
jgi:hypothetical protein